MSDPKEMTEAEKLAELIRKIEVIVPYVTATLGPGNRFPSPRQPDWVEIHGGRCVSSERQLESLLATARSFKP